MLEPSDSTTSEQTETTKPTKNLSNEEQNDLNGDTSHSNEEQNGHSNEEQNGHSIETTKPINEEIKSETIEIKAETEPEPEVDKIISLSEINLNEPTTSQQTSLKGSQSIEFTYTSLDEVKSDSEEQPVDENQLKETFVVEQQLDSIDQLNSSSNNFSCDATILDLHSA